MDTKTLCLGVLSMGPASGYAIKKAFEQAFSHFFAAGFGSIYPALAELAEAGLVTVEQQEQEGRPAKKVYSLTERGRAALVAQLAEAEPRHKVRSEFLVLAFFAHMLPPERLEQVLTQREQESEATAAYLGGLLAGHDLPAGARFAAGFGETVLRAAADYIRANRAWLLSESRTPPSCNQTGDDE